MILSELKSKKIPDNPGVYFFKKGKTILYIGKATSLKSRVRSYFSSDLIKTRGPAILDMITQATNVTFQETDSVLEAILLESALIKKYQPKYNVKEKDNKSYNKVIITAEKYPRILLVRNREILEKKFIAPIKKEFGPFPNASQLREALRLIQKIFPFFDNSRPIDKLNESEQRRINLNVQIGIYPDIFSGKVTGSDYLKTIRHISLFFEGKKKQILRNLEKEMRTLAKNQQFERANEIKRTIFALQHINDVSLLNKESESDQFRNAVDLNSDTKLDPDNLFRIESYDIAHTSGSETVGVMVVSNNSEIDKSQFRKFIIRNSAKNDDYGALSEVLNRRLGHSEWREPNLIVIDGGTGQRNTALEVLKKHNKNIAVISVVKDDKHKACDLLGPADLALKYREHIIKLNSETHRFAITFHRKRRGVIK